MKRNKKTSMNGNKPNTMDVCNPFATTRYGIGNKKYRGYTPERHKADTLAMFARVVAKSKKLAPTLIVVPEFA